MTKPIHFESPLDIVVNDNGDVMSPAGEVNDFQNWDKNRQTLELDHPGFSSGEADDNGVGIIRSTEDDVYINGIRNSSHRGPGYRTQAQRNARAHEAQARRHRGK